MADISRPLAVLLLAGATLGFAPTFLDTPAPVSVADPCINGVWPLNPYVVNCNLQPRQRQAIGAAPDAGALIACRGNPWCLSMYVNGGMGAGGPGAVLTPGYHP